MTKEKYDKLVATVKCGDKKLMDLATFAVDHDCLNVDGSPINGDHRINLITEFSLDMALGARCKRNEYLLLGSLAGGVIVIGAVLIYSKFIKKEKES